MSVSGARMGSWLVSGAWALGWSPPGCSSAASVARVSSVLWVFGASSGVACASPPVAGRCCSTSVFGVSSCSWCWVVRGRRGRPCAPISGRPKRLALGPLGLLVPQVRSCCPTHSSVKSAAKACMAARWGQGSAPEVVGPRWSLVAAGWYSFTTAWLQNAATSEKQGLNCMQGKAKSMWLSTASACETVSEAVEN